MSFSLADLTTSELQQVEAALTRPDELGNATDVEMKWALRAMDHAEIHYNLLSSVDTSRLHLTQIDDKIYQRFRHEFPDLNVAKLTEDDLKSPEAKEKWRNFCESFKDEIEDYNMGSLLRLDCEADYNQENTIFCVRAQFLAIEIARNREGHNGCILRRKQQREAEAARKRDPFSESRAQDS